MTKKRIIFICLYPCRLFEVFYNYRPGPADKRCCRGVRPSGRQEGIVLAGAKMENIKQYSTDDCNLTKPLQGYLTRHIEQGHCILESKTMTTSFWPCYFQRDGFISALQNFSDLWIGSVFIFVSVFSFYLWGVSNGWRAQTDLRMNIETEKNVVSPQLASVSLPAFWANKLHWCAMKKIPSTCSSKFTLGLKNFEPERKHMSFPTASQRQKRKVTLSANYACIQRGVKEKA